MQTSAERSDVRDVRDDPELFLLSNAAASSGVSLQEGFAKFRQRKMTELRKRGKALFAEEERAPAEESSGPRGQAHGCATTGDAVAAPEEKKGGHEVEASKRALWLSALKAYLNQSYKDCDCCALIKNATRDLEAQPHMSWSLGDWNQAYQFALCSEKIAEWDLSGKEREKGTQGVDKEKITDDIENMSAPPTTCPGPQVFAPDKTGSEEETGCPFLTDLPPAALRPGDLIFYEGCYRNSTKKPQPFDIVHVEVYLGGDAEEQRWRTIGSRNTLTGVAILPSFLFPSKLWKLRKIHFMSVTPWLLCGGGSTTPQGGEHSGHPEFESSLREQAELMFPRLKAGKRSVFFDAEELGTG
jgi:hypothetical protein